MPTSIAILPAPPIAVPGVGPGGDLFIFRPLEPAPTGNVFASWIALVAAASVVVGSKRVYFDDSLAPCVIPAGIWDFASPTDFFGDDGQPLVTPTPLAIDDGAVLRNVFGFRSLAITSATTTAVISAPLGGADYYFSGSCRVTQANPAGNFLLAAVGFVFSPVTVTLLEYAEFVTGAAGPASGQVVMVGGVGSQASVVALDHSNVQTNTIGSLGGSAVGSTVDSASIATAQVGMAPIPVGVLTVTLLSAAVREFYDDALVPPLLGVADVQAAIDALKGTIVTGTPFEYVFRPGGVASGNVFTSWLALVAAAATFPGQKLVYFDDTLGPCIIPAGVHNFGTGPAAFTGKPGAGSLTTPLQIVDGAFLLGVVEFSWLLIDSQTTTFCIDAPAGVTTIYIADHVTMITQSGVGGVFIRSTGAGTGAVLSLLQGSNLVSGIALSALAAASITVAVVDGSAVAANTLSAALGTTALGIIVDATGTISTVQPAVLVPFSILLVAQAAKTFYDDALVLPPLGAVEVQGAIDALKGRSLASRSFSGTLLSDAILLPVTSYFGDVPNAEFQSTVGYPADATSQNVTLVVNVTANNVLTTTRFEVYKNNVPTGVFLDYLTTVTGITSITAALVLTAGVDAVDLVATNTTGGAGNQIAASASIRYDA